jgi:2,3-dimethylmalate lyase
MKTIRQLLKDNKSILIPAAHDAITAKIVQKIGFPAMSIGGFGISGSRYGLPDFGIISYREMRDAIAEISGAVDIPVLVDGDNGYGGELNVERMIREYEQIQNISCIFLEDQVFPKRCGHLKGKQIIPTQEMVKKLKTAVYTRQRKDLMIMARTDARNIEGLEEALRRSEDYLKAGADAIFIESPQSEKELEIISRNFKGVNLLVNVLNGGLTPILPQKRLEELGFNMIAYSTLTLLLMAKSLDVGLTSLYQRGDSLAIPSGKMSTMESYHDLIGVSEALKKEAELIKLLKL